MLLRFRQILLLIGGSRWGTNWAEPPPLVFFRYVSRSIVPDTETSIGVIFCIAFK